jgi:hypothetical protein
LPLFSCRKGGDSATPALIGCSSKAIVGADEMGMNAKAPKRPLGSLRLLRYCWRPVGVRKTSVPIQAGIGHQFRFGVGLKARCRLRTARAV